MSKNGKLYKAGWAIKHKLKKKIKTSDRDKTHSVWWGENGDYIDKKNKPQHLTFHGTNASISMRDLKPLDQRWKEVTWDDIVDDDDSWVPSPRATRTRGGKKGKIRKDKKLKKDKKGGRKGKKNKKSSK